MVCPSAVCSRSIVYSTAKMCLHLLLVNSWSRQVQLGFSASSATVYFSCLFVCEGTDQRLLLPWRVSLVLAAISRPLISRGSIVIISTQSGFRVSGYITI